MATDTRPEQHLSSFDRWQSTFQKVSTGWRPDGLIIRAPNAGYAVVQAAPLRVNDPGLSVLPVWLAWNPMLVDAPGGRFPL
jgi:hypothetical protein